MKDFFEKITFPLSLVACIFCFLPLFGLDVVEPITFILCALCSVAYISIGKMGLGAIWAFSSILWLVQIS